MDPSSQYFRRFLAKIRQNQIKYLESTIPLYDICKTKLLLNEIADSYGVFISVIRQATRIFDVNGWEVKSVFI